MLPVNFRTFRKKLSQNRTAFRRFLNKTEKTPPPAIDKVTPVVAQEVWQEVDCLSCANCCKKMTPTFTPADLKRISNHFGQTPDEFRKQWLRKDRNKDLINKTEPCQFLNLQDNKCSIYAIRPADCAGFPHLSKRKWTDYAYIHKQNIDYCPATYKMVEKMIVRFETIKN
ncbi:YkgJ family cysteine cluster protein [Ferruginibacter sp. HRS2-29]|uniref:YkgJ family cysteine cluster protein n=1 Tax=Ferruginibacter sp. HRS2-29 TaxID=2487334 RepID=UPI0020CFB4A7|nr:YkgJ family cysteine cluster protein [Ferruginibacter sp. HRS2-29]MCP9749693.1 YkgJ family cysteine cluster protein [Ferruginibacter sp. HRS2-29]